MYFQGHNLKITKLSNLSVSIFIIEGTLCCTGDGIKTEMAVKRLTAEPLSSPQVLSTIHCTIWICGQSHSLYKDTCKEIYSQSYDDSTGGVHDMSVPNFHNNLSIG